MKRFSILLFLVVPFWCVVSSLGKPKTGASHADYLITPVAYSDSGTVLCRTERMINEMGAYRCMPVSFGYLAISRNGTWKEVKYKTTRDEFDYDSLDMFRKRFYAKVNLEKPPKIMGGLIKEYGINHLVKKEKETGYYWNKDGLYNSRDTLIRKDVQQTSLRKLASSKGKGLKTKATWQVMGVLFFENVRHYEGNKGAYFYIPTEFGKIDHYTITGIAFL